jgi:plasmid stabilization system protein ParE
MKLIFSDIAKLEYEEIVYFLNNKYNKQIAAKFIAQLQSQLKLIKQFPESLPFFFDTTYRKCMINANITVIYKINDAKNRIEILNFWFNKSKPEIILKHLQ